MNTLTRDDTEHGKEYVLKSEADAIEAERATLWTRCRDIEAKLVTQQAISAELRAEVQQLKLAEEGAAEAFGAVVQDKRDLEAEVKRPQDGEPRFRVSDDGRTISDEDFIFDVLIRVGGDFGDDALRTSYAQWMCGVLNEADKHLPREPRGA